MLLKNPGFTAMAVLTLALGIGATAAVCSLIQGVLSTPPLYRKPEQLILITPESLDRRYRLSAGVSGHGADSVPDPGEVGPGQTNPTHWLESEEFLETTAIPNGFTWTRNQASVTASAHFAQTSIIVSTN